jgi:hypothetical protein
MLKYILSKIVPFTLLPIAILSVQRYSYSPIGNTAIWWLIQIIILLVYGLAAYVFSSRENKKVILIFKLFLLWNIINIIRGIFIAETYWDYKGLIEMSLALFIPLITFIALDRENVQSILSFYVKFILPFSVLILPFVPIGFWGWYLFPMGFLILFIPALKMHWSLLIIFVSILAMLLDLSTRSYIFKYGLPVLFLLFYYYRVFPESKKIMVFINHVFMILPFIFFFLAVSGIFNVFRISDYLKIDYEASTKNAEGKVMTQDVTQDSRTFIYEEVLQSSLKHKYWLIGRSPARGNDTVAFAHNKTDIDMRGERLRNEANITNVFTWTGIIGIVLFFLVFYRASWLAIKRSNNIYSKIIGLYVAFRWMYAWVEDFYSFDINTIMIWFMIGICFSESFRKMNNLEVKLWARGIFESRYQKAFHVYSLKSTT